MRPGITHYFVVILLIFSSGCGAQRAPQSEEIAASNESADWVINRYGVVPNRDVMRYFSALEERLARAIEALPARYQADLTINSLRGWQLIVLNSVEPNAFSVGSGIIFLTKGFVRHCHSEAMLAAVVAHEMSHQLLGHTSELIAETATSDGAPRYQFRLDQELAADRLSLEILKIAHYDLRHSLAALSLAYRPEERVVSSMDGYLQRRAAALEQAVAELGAPLPATQTTRAFVKLHESLAKY